MIYQHLSIADLYFLIKITIKTQPTHIFIRICITVFFKYSNLEGCKYRNRLSPILVSTNFAFIMCTFLDNLQLLFKKWRSIVRFFTILTIH